MTKFEKWFKAQFGRLPLQPHQREKLFQLRQAYETKYLQAKIAIEKDDRLVHQYTAAMYAKNAAKKDFEI